MASSSPAVGPWARGHSWRVPVDDLPWRRLPWILPVAIALWLLALWGFGRFMATPVSTPPETPPLDAQIVELPPPPEPPKLPEPPVAKPQPVVPKVQAAPPQPAPPKPSLPVDTAPSPAAPVNPLPAPPPPPPAASQPPASSSANPNQGRTGAYAIVKPEPKIPDDLADDDAKYNPAIKFNIAPDGSFTVELTNPTPNPRLNRIYLDTVKNYKFFPATEDGKPVASSLTIRFTHNK